MMDLSGTERDYVEMTRTPDYQDLDKGGMVLEDDELAERGDHWRGLAMQTLEENRELRERVAYLEESDSGADARTGERR